jgi:hypothetical protein
MRNFITLVLQQSPREIAYTIIICHVYTVANVFIHMSLHWRIAKTPILILNGI